jgi:uncharacterized protein YqjF (DUF2071 family)
MRHDFDYRILDQTAHRPWPMPATPWIMTQSWHDLLFAHWPVDPGALRTFVPAPLEIDVFDRQAWVGIVPFHMTNVAPRGVPAPPWLSSFAELNVRTYVRIHDRPGVYFFSLDAANAVAVRTARALFRLPYFTASIEVTRTDGWIRYRSRRAGTRSARAELVASYRPAGEVFHAAPGTLEYFLTERYCLYTVNRGGRAHVVDVHHPPWPLSCATARIEANTMASVCGVALPQSPPLLYFAARQDVVAWMPRRFTG